MINECQEIIEGILSGLRFDGVITNEQRHAADIQTPHLDTAMVGLEIEGRTYIITVEDATS